MMTLSQSSRGIDFSTLQRHQRMGFKCRRHRSGKAVAIDGEGATCRHLIFVCRSHDERAEPAHFFMQKTDCIVLAII